MVDTSKSLQEKADWHRKEADRLEALATAMWREELSNKPLLARMIFASHARCPCGAGLAYDPSSEEVSRGHGYWDCSAIILGTADASVRHEVRMPFVFWDIKSENQPSAYGATTRPEKML